MTVSGRFARVFWVLCWCSFAGAPAAGAGRLKRELRFPKGGSFVAAVALASLLPKGPTDGFAHVLEFDLGFPFPEKIQIGKATTGKKTWENRRRGGIQSKLKSTRPNRFRRRTNLKEDQRQKLLFHVEDAINRVGFNGSTCVSRLRCDLRHASPKSSLLEELLFALVPPPSHSQDKECHRLHLGCPVSLLHALMYSQQISLVSDTHRSSESFQGVREEGCDRRKH